MGKRKSLFFFFAAGVRSGLNRCEPKYLNSPIRARGPSVV